MTAKAPTPVPQPRTLHRWLGPVAIVALMALAYGLGLHSYLTLDSLALHRTTIQAFTRDHLVLAICVYAVIYATAVALSFPGAALLTVAGGFLFGWLLGGMAAVAGATVGAIAVFLVARSAFGDLLARKAGPALARIRAGFAADAFSYLLFLRLVPLFPFWLVNLAGALANVPLRSFATATVLGIIPATFAFAFAGEGLDSVLAVQAQWQACAASNTPGSCPDKPSLADLATPQLLLALVALALVALLPVALKTWKGRQ